MPIAQSELVEKWGLTKGRISQLVSEGMPLDSLEAAETWRQERYRNTGFPGRGVEAPPVDAGPVDEAAVDAAAADGFGEVIERQRQLVKVARNQYIKSIKDGSPLQSRYYTSYDKTLQTLLKLERELASRAVASRDYVKAEHLVARFERVLADLRQMMEQGELDVAPAANPENPAKALKAFREWKLKVLKTVSRSSAEAISGLSLSNDEGTDKDA